MNTIVRIQAPNGQGVYQNDLGYEVIGQYQSVRSNPRLPKPNEDGGLVQVAPHLFCESGWNGWLGTEYIFGFKDVEQLLKWFNFNDKLFEKLDVLNFEIVLLEGEVFHGTAQSITKKETAKTLKRAKVLEFLSNA